MTFGWFRPLPPFRSFLGICFGFLHFLSFLSILRNCSNILFVARVLIRVIAQMQVIPISTQRPRVKYGDYDDGDDGDDDDNDDDGELVFKKEFPD